MTTKTVKLYCCDFCKKKGRSAGHIRKHEKHCTMNPNRECNVCKMIGGNQLPIEELKAFLAGLTIEKGDFDCEGINEAAINERLPALRKACGNCPACIMATLRQCGIPVPVATGFNWTEEMTPIWADINHANTGFFYPKTV
jgi:hypothetical protein